jgi:hypothetical protein
VNPQLGRVHPPCHHGLISGGKGRGDETARLWGSQSSSGPPARQWDHQHVSVIDSRAQEPCFALGGAWHGTYQHTNHNGISILPRFLYTLFAGTTTFHWLIADSIWRKSSSCCYALYISFPCLSCRISYRIPYHCMQAPASPYIALHLDLQVEQQK